MKIEFIKCPIINNENANVKHIVRTMLILSFIFKYTFPNITLLTFASLIHILFFDKYIGK